jgi:hypothetical protein
MFGEFSSSFELDDLSTSPFHSVGVMERRLYYFLHLTLRFVSLYYSRLLSLLFGALLSIRIQHGGYAARAFHICSSATISPLPFLSTISRIGLGRVMIWVRDDRRPTGLSGFSACDGPRIRGMCGLRITITS